MDLRSPSYNSDCKGVAAVASFELRRNQRIIVALGQQGNPTNYSNGCGGSYLVLETPDGPEPLLVAGGPGYGELDQFASGQFGETGSGNDIIGTSGVQLYLENDQPKIYCAGAGFVSAPQARNLEGGSRAPNSYAGGLNGGRGLYGREITEGGFGGGGAVFKTASGKYYWGAGGGYTGGAHRRDETWKNRMQGGGGGSFSSSPNTKFSHHGQAFGSCKIELLSS